MYGDQTALILILCLTILTKTDLSKLRRIQCENNIALKVRLSAGNKGAAVILRLHLFQNLKYNDGLIFDGSFYKYQRFYLHIHSGPKA